MCVSFTPVPPTVAALFVFGDRYQCGDYSASSPDDWGQWPAFSVIVARFIADGSPDEINIR